jgi:cytochrome c oxidase subunit 4
MSHEGTEDIKHHVRVYIRVFMALMVLTIITVAVSYMHLAVPLAITVALVIACVKGSLVAGYFMHLVSEKKIIYAALALTVVFFFVLLFYPTFGHIGAIGEHNTGAIGHVSEGVSPAVH